MWGSEPVLQAVSTLVGGGFLLYSFISAVTGSYFDADDGWILRAERPVAFWISIGATTCLGLLILGAGYHWPPVEAAIRFFEERF
jgi:hypothetical protein